MRRIARWIVFGAVVVGSSVRSAGADDPPARVVPLGRISGTVVDEAGAPVAGVRVDLSRFQLARGGSWSWWTDLGVPAVTDGAGRFGFGALRGMYLVRAGRAGAAEVWATARVRDGEIHPIPIVLRPPVVPVLRLLDAEGRPVAGARVRELAHRGGSGATDFTQIDLKSLGIAIPPSGLDGQLTLPAMAAGDTFRAVVEHPHLAPVAIPERVVAAGVEVAATMRPGVELTLRVPPTPPAGRIGRAVLDLQPTGGVTASHLQNSYEVEFDTRGVARLAIAPGDYDVLLLQHEDWYLIPGTHGTSLRIEPGRNDDLTFRPRRKVAARGRVVDAATGQPAPGVTIRGEIAAGEGSDSWSFATWASTDADGYYRLDLAAGRARVSASKLGMTGEPASREVFIAADGSTVIPDAQVRPLPTVAGVVRNPDGSPAPRAVVRIRGRFLFATQPVLTDEAGRFAIRPGRVAADDPTAPLEVVAFDPARPLAARGAARPDAPGPLVLNLEPHEPDWPLTAVDDAPETPATAAARPDPDPEPEPAPRPERLRGLVPPELDGAAWINTGGRPLTLAGLRGRYVLLDFWFKGCGPCHQDFPSVTLAHELFEGKGVTVIGIHLNLNPPAEVAAHVAEVGLPFPVLVDHADGRSAAFYQAHGVALSCPSYVLIGPDGRVLLDSGPDSPPTLRPYKLEILRRHLLAAPAPR